MGRRQPADGEGLASPRGEAAERPNPENRSTGSTGLRDLVSREQLGRLIGKHERTIRRWEQTRLAPALLVGEDGTHRFDLARVRELIEVREGRVDSPAGVLEDGETTAVVFELFSQGIQPVEVVIRMKLPAPDVGALYREWAALRGGFVVDLETAREISALRRETILEAPALLRNLRARPPAACDGCHEEFGDAREARGRGAAFCGLCARQMSARQAEEAAAAEAAAREERQRRREQQKRDAEHEKVMRQSDAEFYRTLRAFRREAGK